MEYGRQETGVDAIEWAERVEALGAGELVVTSINQEGTGQGFDLELTRRIAEAVSIPVIAAGGAGSVEHVSQVIQEGKADAVCIASLLHYNVVRQQQYAEEQFKVEGNVEFLQGRRGGAGFSKIQETTLPELKDYLAQQGIDVRQQIIEEGA